MQLSDNAISTFSLFFTDPYSMCNYFSIWHCIIILFHFIRIHDNF